MFALILSMLAFSAQVLSVFYSTELCITKRYCLFPQQISTHITGGHFLAAWKELMVNKNQLLGENNAIN
jgi:hypothetical protein